MYTLLAATKHVFDDGVAYLGQLSEAEYAAPVACLSGSSIGQHTRHWIEFFQCLFWQVRDERDIICYDDRQRDLRLESDPAFAQQAIGSLSELMGTLNTDQLLTLKTSIGPDQIECSTSLGREWWYAIEHAIHHLAIIKIGLADCFQQVTIPAGFGVAYSTKNYQSFK
ncbi:MAG: hypothetical protein AAF828_12270 [Bacteroidota bacterium]